MTRRRIFWALTALWLLFIWGHSMMSAGKSSAESGRVLLWVRQFFPGATMHFVRKAAHFTEYAVLGALLLGATDGGRFRPLAFPAGFGISAAALDETIQIFSEGRSAQISDAGLDFAGFAVSYGLLKLLASLKKPS